MRKDKGPAHNPGYVIAASANTCLHYGQPGEKPVDKYLALSISVLTHISFKAVDCSWSHVWTLWLQKQSYIRTLGDLF